MGTAVLVEASAHPVLAMPLSAASGEGAGVVVGSLRREAGGMSELLRNLGVLHVHGVAVDWEKVLGASASKQVVALPTYAFQRQRYWLEAEKASGDVSTMGLWSVAHPLLGAATPLADSDAVPADGSTVGDGAGMARRSCRCSGRCWCRGRDCWSLALRRRVRLGATTVSQLTLVAPLVLPQERCGAGSGPGGCA